MTLLGLTSVVVLTGIIIVFAILSILTLVTDNYGKIIRAIKSIFTQDCTINKIPETSVKNETFKTPDEEIIAVISASIYALDLNYGTKYKIKSIKPLEKTNSSAWKLASLLENTNIYKF